MIVKVDMMKILVTGSAGYIGSHVVKELNRSGFETIGLDNFVHGHSWAVRGDFIECDLLDSKKLRNIFETHDISAVIHFAGFAYVSESVLNPLIYYQNNVIGTLNLLEAMIKNNVKDIIFSSSCTVYGIPHEIPISESHPTNPINPYGRTKLIIEKILYDFQSAYGIRYVSLRYFNAAGADPDGELGEVHTPETHLIPNIINAALTGDKIEIFGTDYPTIDGTCIRDYIHVTDLASAHILALKYILEGGENDTFNLGNSRGYSVREIINIVKEITKKDIKVKEGSRRNGDPPILMANNNKARKILGWKSNYPQIETIIESAWNWQLKYNSDRKYNQI